MFSLIKSIALPIENNASQSSENNVSFAIQTPNTETTLQQNESYLHEY